MKKTLLLSSILLISFIGFGQSKKDTTSKQKVDTTQLTADTKFISINDVWRLAEKYYKTTIASDYDIWRSLMTALLQDAANEWVDKHKPKKP